MEEKYTRKDCSLNSSLLSAFVAYNKLNKLLTNFQLLKSQTRITATTTASIDPD